MLPERTEPREALHRSLGEPASALLVASGFPQRAGELESGEWLDLVVAAAVDDVESL